MPKRFGRYVVQRRVGVGGFATVWLAYDEQLDSPVAVKVLADNWAADADIRRRFVAEGRYLRRVESPYVVTVYDAGELEDERPYLVMTYADQGTLADRLADGDVPALTPAQSVEVVDQIATGLQALHDSDLVHRDVKPANVLFRSITGNGGAGLRAMVGDLGFGKALDGSSRLTMIAGTPTYVAPEQAAAEPVDARADQYSLAALAHLLLTGRPAFTHETLTAAARPAPIPPVTAAGFAPEADAVLRRALAPVRTDRFATVRDFADALAATLESDRAATVTAARSWDRPTEAIAHPTPTPIAPVSRGRRRRGALAALVLVLLGLAAGLGAYAVSSRHEGTATLTDDRGRLSVQVPSGWRAHLSRSGWRPPGQKSSRFPALAAGTRADWATMTVPAEGVFAGIMPGTHLPEQLPGHPDCELGARRDTTDARGEAMATTPYHACPEGVVVERVVQVAPTRLLWVQVRATTTTRAYDVLESVRATGV